MIQGSRTSEYACALIEKDGKVLLGRRAHFRSAYPNCWDFIGGRIETGETAEQALMRELGEEIAISPKDISFFDSISDIHIDPENPPTYHVFKIGDWDGGEPSINNHEHSHVEWFTLIQACDLSNLAMPEYRALLQAALKG